MELSGNKKRLLRPLAHKDIKIFETGKPHYTNIIKHVRQKGKYRYEASRALRTPNLADSDSGEPLNITSCMGVKKICGVHLFIFSFVYLFYVFIDLCIH